ncbi:MAG: hypothetical protein IJY50_03940 [Clostridia bacterium]|nr:hypothetical protein [Clostridia bacterium]
MKNTTEEKKSSTRIHFNVLDAVLILLALLCIVGIWQRKNLQNLFDSGESLETYTVTFEIKKLRSTTANLLVKDTELYILENESKVSLGTLTEQLATSAATVYLQTGSGETVKAVYPQDDYEYLLDANGVLSCRGIEHDGAFLLGGKTYLAVNQTVQAHTELADFEIRITGIQKVG